jgi:hypothetical protein
MRIGSAGRDLDFAGPWPERAVRRQAAVIVNDSLTMRA